MVIFALIVIIGCYICKKRSRARPVVRNAYTPSTSSTSGVDLAMSHVSHKVAVPSAYMYSPYGQAITVSTEGSVGVVLSNDVPLAAYEVTAGGAAEAAGVPLGARLVAFNATDTTTMSKPELMELIIAATGQKTFHFVAAAVPGTAVPGTAVLGTATA